MSKYEMETPPVIKMTKDLSIFKELKGNRATNKAHIKRLAEAISLDVVNTKYHPLLVNEKMQLIDGQHRVEAFKMLKIPAYYIVAEGLGLADAQSLNQLSKQWSPTDYARSFSDRGNKSYAIYLEFKEEYGLNHDILMRYINLEPLTTEMFRRGLLKARNVEASHDLATKLLDFERFIERFKQRSFAIAFQIMWQHEGYDHEKMLKILDKKVDKLEFQATPEDYLRVLEGLYNGANPVEKKGYVRFF